MGKRQNLVRVHTHTHTHTSNNFIDKKRVVESYSKSVAKGNRDLLDKYVKTYLFNKSLFSI